MALFTSPEDILVTAMSAKQSGVHLNHVVGSLEGVFKKALKKERRLCAFLSGYSANYMKKGLVQLATDYDVTLTYQPEFFKSLGFVVINKEELPHKVWKECIDCPKFPNCDEIAMVKV